MFKNCCIGLRIIRWKPSFKISEYALKNKYINAESFSTVYEYAFNLTGGITVLRLIASYILTAMSQMCAMRPENSWIF